MWFYRGGTRKLIAHWFDPAAIASLCQRLKPDSRGVAARHPLHDQHIPQCQLCKDRIAARKKVATPVPPPVGVVIKGGTVDS